MRPMVSYTFATLAFHAAGIGTITIFKINLNVGTSLSHKVLHLLIFTDEEEIRTLLSFSFQSYNVSLCGN
jgi:hypothetical protein